jgi:predicted GNAT family acetyltransferase
MPVRRVHGVTMEARVHQSPVEFRDTVLPLLLADPIRQTVPLTALDQLTDGSLLMTLHHDGNLAGAVLQVPPYPLLTTPMPIEAADVTAKAVFTARPDLSSAGGPVEVVEAFVAAWTELTGATAHQDIGLRLFELGELRPPTVVGTARVATEEDLDLLISWWEAFMADTGHRQLTRDQVVANVRHSLTPGNINFLWQVDDQPVALATAKGPVPGMTRIGPVYTPPEHRGHGYAAAATAAASQWSLDQGAEHVLLYTDLANELTNRLYPRIGYRALTDFAEYSFS